MEDTQQRGPAAPGNREAETPKDKPSFWKRPGVIVAGSVLLAVILFLGLHFLARHFSRESTDDAFLDGDVVSVAPRVAGQVKRVLVQPNQIVKAGDLLVEIDPRDYDVEVAAKTSGLTAAHANEKVIKATFELLGVQVISAEATARESDANAVASRATAEKAAADLRRAEDLFQRKAISSQEYDTAKTGATAASASADADKEKAVSDHAKVDAARAQLDAGREAYARAQAQTDETRIDLEQAQLSQSYTRITAPQDGRITHKSVTAGDYVQVSQRLMAIVPTNIWVTANFKETQLRRIRVGQRVDISIDAIAGETFSGRVESIQAGSGAAFSLLPPENAVGNFVKVVQRVPVRILFDPPIKTDHVLGPGMSAAPSARITDFELPALIEALIALALAVVGGLVWARLAGGNRSSRPAGG